MFDVYPYQMKGKYERKYCNLSCRGIGRVAWNKGLTKETDVRVEAYIEKSAKTRKGMTMSNEWVQNRIFKSGKEHWNWRGGKSSAVSTRCQKKWWKELAKKVYERDNWTCQICGEKCHNGKRIQCHHIIPERFEGTHDINNLQTLCLSCHIIADKILAERKWRPVEAHK